MIGLYCFITVSLLFICGWFPRLGSYWVLPGFGDDGARRGAAAPAVSPRATIKSAATRRPVRNRPPTVARHRRRIPAPKAKKNKNKKKRRRREKKTPFRCSPKRKNEEERKNPNPRPPFHWLVRRIATRSVPTESTLVSVLFFFRSVCQWCVRTESVIGREPTNGRWHDEIL